MNAPITLAFVAICALSLLLNYLTDGYTNSYIFSTYNASLLDPLTYVRLFAHIFGHVSVEHFISNMMYIILLGPILEEKYGDRLIIVIFATALFTGIIHNIFFIDYALLGASGVCFAFIILASITGDKRGIPLTLIIVTCIWIGGELYKSFTVADNISQLAHIIGGTLGALLGLAFKNREL